MVWIICMAWKASVWIKILGYSASHKGVLGELEEQLGEQVEDSLGLGESVLGLGESDREVQAFSG